MIVRFAPKALADVDAILSYLVRDSPAAAAGFERRTKELIELIRINVYVGRATDRRNVRIVNARPYPYLLFYRVAPTEIRIMRIIHGARSPRSMPARPR